MTLPLALVLLSVTLVLLAAFALWRLPGTAQRRILGETDRNFDAMIDAKRDHAERTPIGMG